MAIPRVPVVIGDCRFRSVAFSNRWSLEQNDRQLALARRIPSRHVSEVMLADGSVLEIRPQGWGTVVAADEDDGEMGRVVRTSWLGRSWDLSTPSFACRLTSDPLPRRWSLRIGTEPVGRLSGSPLSYNRLRIHADVAVPVVGLLLAWHVLARPWEAAATPVTLVPVRAPRAAYRLHPDA
jgi:hypothetical protein